MKKNTVAFFGFLLFVLLSLSSNAQEESPPLKQKNQDWEFEQKLSNFWSKLHYGIGGNVAYSTNYGVSRVRYNSNDFSGDSFKVMPTIEYAIFGVIQYSISSRLELEMALGYANQKENIYIYPSFFFSLPPTPEQIEKHLIINLHHIHLPVQFSWKTKSRLDGNPTMYTLCVTPRFLLKEINNYNDLIYHLVGLGNTASPIVLTTEAGITQRFEFPNNKQVDLSVFGGINLTDYIISDWGFLSNLKLSKNVQIGLQLKYFFN